ncbi:MAG: SulP family inorganic anion transporter, partial [Nitrospirota bacterium]
MLSQHPVAPSTEKPQNGVRGLKHWRYDLMAGLQVALIGLPLSLGIAVASGAPPITGVISAIIAGVIFPFLGGAYVTISGPAAGLAPALLAGMIALGHGDLSVGYPLLLVAICLTGVVQVGLSLFRAGRFALYFPISVVEGMLSAIGMLIIIKQIPQLLGDQLPPVKSISEAILAIPHDIHEMNPEIFLVGGLSLVLLFFLSSRKERWATLIPAPLLLVSLGGIASWFLQLPQEYLVHVPL